MSARTRSLPRACGALHGVEDHRARVAALGAAHDLDAGALRPLLELLGRPRPGRCRPRRAAPNGRPPSRGGPPCRWWWSCPRRSRRRTATRWCAPRSKESPASPGGVERAAQILAQRGHDGVGAAQLAAAHAGAQVLEQGRGGGHAHVGAQQRLLEVVPRLVVDRRPAPQRPHVARDEPAVLPMRSRSSGGRSCRRSPPSRVAGPRAGGASAGPRAPGPRVRRGAATGGGAGAAGGAGDRRRGRARRRARPARPARRGTTSTRPTTSVATTTARTIQRASMASQPTGGPERCGRGGGAPTRRWHARRWRRAPRRRARGAPSG